MKKSLQIFLMSVGGAAIILGGLFLIGSFVTSNDNAPYANQPIDRLLENSTVSETESTTTEDFSGNYYAGPSTLEVVQQGENRISIGLCAGTQSCAMGCLVGRLKNMGNGVYAGNVKQQDEEPGYLTITFSGSEANLSFPEGWTQYNTGASCIVEGTFSADHEGLVQDN